MKRRELLQTMAGLGVTGTTVRTWPDERWMKRAKHGRLTVEGHRAHQRLTGETLHVFVHGIDVTRSSFEADDAEGYVLLYCRDHDQHKDLTAKGAIHIGRDGAACSMRIDSDTVMIVSGPEIK